VGIWGGEATKRGKVSGRKDGFLWTEGHKGHILGGEMKIRNEG